MSPDPVSLLDFVILYLKFIAYFEYYIQPHGNIISQHHFLDTKSMIQQKVRRTQRDNDFHFTWRQMSPLYLHSDAHQLIATMKM